MIFHVNEMGIRSLRRAFLSHKKPHENTVKTLARPWLRCDNLYMLKMAASMLRVARTNAASSRHVVRLGASHKPACITTVGAAGRRRDGSLAIARHGGQKQATLAAGITCADPFISPFMRWELACP